jgi:FAD:protein FMN transferase
MKSLKPGTMKTDFAVLLSAVFCLLFSALACVPQNGRIFKKSRIIMDTLVTITVVARTSSEADVAIERAFHEIERLEKIGNVYSPESEISQINRNAGNFPVKVSPDVFELLVKAKAVAETTGGAFDPTIGPVISLYDFRSQIKPGDAAIRKNLSLVDYRNMIINREQSTVFLKHRGMLIDAGGIMKGYAAEKTAEVLKKHGVYSGIVAVAGDIRAFGLKPDGKPWRVGIRDPRGQGQDNVIAVIELTNMSISTSGDYERFFMLNGKRVHHLISPKTGQPAEGCQSASIVSSDGALADAYSTGIFILGPEKGMNLSEKIGIDGMIVDEKGMLNTTPGIREHLELQNPA